MSANTQVVTTTAPWMLIITIVLAVLKTTGVINWSWWIITAPLWAGIAVWAVIVVIILLFAGVLGLIGVFAEGKTRKKFGRR